MRSGSFLGSPSSALLKGSAEWKELGGSSPPENASAIVHLSGAPPPTHQSSTRMEGRASSWAARTNGMALLWQAWKRKLRPDALNGFPSASAPLFYIHSCPLFTIAPGGRAARIVPQGERVESRKLKYFRYPPPRQTASVRFPGSGLGPAASRG